MTNDMADLKYALYQRPQRPPEPRTEKQGLVFALGLVLGFILGIMLVMTDVQGAY